MLKNLILNHYNTPSNKSLQARKTYSGAAIALAWPETNCKQTGAWYDYIMKKTGFNKDGYYQVGHAAVILVHPVSGNCFYFDFGRYHAPPGFGRVRDTSTDHDLRLNSKLFLQEDMSLQIDSLLEEVQSNESTHGCGPVQAGWINIQFDKALARAKKIQDACPKKYGPFEINGTNCSRFVADVLRAGGIPLSTSVQMFLPYIITPSPASVVKALAKNISYEKNYITSHVQSS